MESKNRTDKVAIIYVFSSENKPVWALRENREVAYKTKKELLDYLDFDGPTKKIGDHTETNQNGIKIARPIYEIDFNRNQKYQTTKKERKFATPTNVEEAAINFQLTGEQKDLDMISKYIIKKYSGFVFNKTRNRTDFGDEDVDSIISDIITRIHKSIQKWNAAKFTTWIHTCIINEIKVYYQTKQRYTKKHVSLEFETERHDDVDVLNNQKYGIQEPIHSEVYNDDNVIYLERRKVIDEVISESFSGDNLNFVSDYFTGNFTYRDLMDKYQMEDYDVKNRIFNAKRIIKKNKKISEFQSEFI